MADINYEAAVTRAERANGGKKMTDFEVILYLQGEMERYRNEAFELREKMKSPTNAEIDFEHFAQTAYSSIHEIYENMSAEEQYAFDLGEMFGKLQTIKEDEPK